MSLQTLQLGMEWFSEAPGGLNRVYAHLLSELSAQGVESTGLVAGTPDVARASHGLATAFAPSTAPLPLRLRALRTAALPWLRTHGQDSLIVSHFAPYALPLIDFTRRRPFVVHFQGPWGQESLAEGASRLSAMGRELIERQVYQSADAAIVLSSAFQTILHARFAVPLEKIHVIPGGVEVGRFATTRTRAECRAELGWPVDRPIVLCVRRLVRRVGLDALIDAVVDVRHSVPDVLVLIAGSGPIRVELERQITERGLENSVRLLGFVPDALLPTAYRSADLSVVPSLSLEGFGLITAESLAAGTPCAVTPVDALTEIISPLCPQLVAASSSPRDIADVLARALRGDIPLPSDTDCVEYARRHYDWPVIAARVRAVYEAAVS